MRLDTKYITKYGTKYLALPHSNRKYERIFNRFRYFIMLKNNITDIYPIKYMEMLTFL